MFQYFKNIMNNKQLNLSILVKDLNSTNSAPAATPRPLTRGTPTVKFLSRPNSPNKNVNMSFSIIKQNPKFRQWPEPPPAPSRSRNMERSSTIRYKRPGSIDSRFHRTIPSNTPPKTISPRDVVNNSMQNVKDYFINSASSEIKSEESTTQHCTSSTIASQNSAVNEIEPQCEILFQSPKSSSTTENKIMYDKIPIIELKRTDSLSEIFNNYKPSDSLKSKLSLNIDNSYCHEMTNSLPISKSTNKYSQTDITFNAKCKGTSSFPLDYFKPTEQNKQFEIQNRSEINGIINFSKNFKEKSNLAKKISDIVIGNENLRLLTEKKFIKIIFFVVIGLICMTIIALTKPFFEYWCLEFYYTYISPKPVKRANFLVDYISEIFSFADDIFGENYW